MSPKGIGHYQKILRKITEIQIVYVLLDRPYTYEELREKTLIQRNTLSKILKLFVSRDMIRRHKLSIKEGFLDQKSHAIKNGSYYHIINLNSHDVQRYIADPTPYYLEEYLKNPDLSNKEKSKYGTNTIKKIRSISSYMDLHSYCSDKLIQSMEKEIKNTFSIKEVLDISNKIENKSPQDYQDTIKQIKNLVRMERFEMEKRFRKHKPEYLEELKKFIDNGMGAYDFLIYFVCKYFDPSFNYNSIIFRMFWNMIKQYDL